jgi:hypothetical protein
MKSDTTWSTAIPHPAMAIPVWPVGTNTDPSPRRRVSRSSSRQTVIFPRTQSDPTVRTVWAFTWRLAPVGTSRSSGTLRRSRTETPLAAAAAAISASSERNSCRPLSMSSPSSIARRMLRRNAGGRWPPAGATPIRSVVGPCAMAASTSATTGASDTSPATWSPARVPALVESTTATVGASA